MTDVGVAALSGYAALESLTLSLTRVADAGLAALRDCPLTELYVDDTDLKDEGLASLGYFALDSLSLSCCEELTLAGLNTLIGRQRTLRPLNLPGENGNH